MTLPVPSQLRSLTLRGCGPHPTRVPPISSACAYAVYDSGKAIYFVLWAPESAAPVSGLLPQGGCCDLGRATPLFFFAGKPLPPPPPPPHTHPLLLLLLWTVLQDVVCITPNLHRQATARNNGPSGLKVSCTSGGVSVFHFLAHFTPSAHRPTHALGHLLGSWV